MFHLQAPLEHASYFRPIDLLQLPGNRVTGFTHAVNRLPIALVSCSAGLSSLDYCPSPSPGHGAMHDTIISLAELLSQASFALVDAPPPALGLYLHHDPGRFELLQCYLD